MELLQNPAPATLILFIIAGIASGMLTHSIDQGEVRGGIVGTLLAGIVGAFAGGIGADLYWDINNSAFAAESIAAVVAGSLVTVVLYRLLFRINDHIKTTTRYFG